MNAQLPLPITAPFSKAQRATIANLVARAAQTEILPRFRKLDSGAVSTKSNVNDLVTAGDTAAEAMITRGLQIAFPNAVIVGEEAAEKGPDYRKKLDQAELAFLIDPIDGTWNFVQGLPLFGTMIAACRFGRPVFGMVYDPLGRDLIWADIESPTAWVPRVGTARKQFTRTKTPLNDMIGFIDANVPPSTEKQVTFKAAAELGSVSSLRCSAHHYRLLAQGSVDFYLAAKLSPWDHAAGVILCKQAGGHAAMLDGTPYTTGEDSGFLLCAGDKDSWGKLADHFSDLLPTA